VKDENDFYQSAIAFGRFQWLLADYPAEQLHETIPNFHNTVERFRRFQEALQADVCGRAARVPEEIRFVLEREALTHVLVDQQNSGELPLRVTHNDTKLNNIMIDDQTGRAICVIDRVCLSTISEIRSGSAQALRWRMKRISQRYPVTFIFMRSMSGDLSKAAKVR
jgi:hypothetical protein